MGVDVGDTIGIEVGGQTTSLEVTGVVYDFPSFIVYTERDNLDPFFPSDKCTGVWIQLEDNDRVHVESKATEMRMNPQVSGVVVQDNISKTKLSALVQAVRSRLFQSTSCVQ